MRKILKALWITQEIDNRERRKNSLPVLGNGCMYAQRLNPFNPLSYLFFIGAVVVGLFAVGIIGLKNEWYNPFKWS